MSTIQESKSVPCRNPIAQRHQLTILRIHTSESDAKFSLKHSVYLQSSNWRMLHNTTAALLKSKKMDAILSKSSMWIIQFLSPKFQNVQKHLVLHVYNVCNSIQSENSKCGIALHKELKVSFPSCRLSKNSLSTNSCWIEKHDIMCHAILVIMKLL